MEKMSIKLLHERQSWTLSQKVDHTLGVIDQFISRMDGKVYLAFSGGKDSTVLMHLCEMLKKHILCVFSNTGCELPSIIHFVRKMKDDGHNIHIIRPTKTPRQVWEEQGFPLVGKKIAHHANLCQGCVKNGKDFPWYIMDEKSFYFVPEKWRYLFYEPYRVNDACCKVLKKDPMHKFNKESALFPIIGVMASESRMRSLDYVRQGQCNSFEEGNIKSLPLSIWLEEDIWQFIKDRNIEIADIYYKGALRTGCAACGFGCQFPDDTRLQLLMENYPKYYDMVMNFTNNGITYREAMRKMLAVNGLYLPDENPQLSFDFKFD